MKDSYFKYEKYIMILASIAVAYVFIGCANPNIEAKKYEEYYCAGNGFWYKKTGTTKLEIIMKDGKFLPCADERL